MHPGKPWRQDSSMSSMMFTAYLWISWIGFGMVWPTWLLRLAFIAEAKAVFSWKTLQMTIIPVIITVFAVHPPTSLLLIFLYAVLVYIAIIAS
jgi:hypothetical protein